MDKAVKKQLKAQAHHLNPVIIIGAKGLTPAVLDETNIALDAHELIKIKVNGADKAERLDITTSLCDALQAEFIQLIGHIAIVYRKNNEA
ncbi:MAG: YhbY family RNA-binding protein [Gammaproteobacteria bacterium]|nr:YhbY family RNA-binding protein [Gammaproteobacteria bacterium]